jgi:hypothetical protein
MIVIMNSVQRKLLMKKIANEWRDMKWVVPIRKITLTKIQCSIGRKLIKQERCDVVFGFELEL